MKSRMQATFALIFFLLTADKLFSQTTTDGFYMAKGNLCIVGDYSYSSWKNYWEGTRKKETHYIGTFKSQSTGLMIGLGITDKILFTAALPYIWTTSTEFYNSGQKGFQDFSAGLKWKIFTRHFAGGDFSFQPSIEGNIPVSDYIPDAMPFSIGNQSKTFKTTGVIDYLSDKNFFATFHWGYVFRSNIHVDATSYYYEDELYYTDEMFVPDLIVYGGQLGYNVDKFRAEGWVKVQVSQGGSDIRPNDKPYPFNRMNACMAGVTGKYSPLSKLPDLYLNASLGYTLSGRNVGQATAFSIGAQYIVKCF